jgi:putative addiction module antidote
MAIPLKITQIGNSLGLILPKEMLTALKVSKGDTLMCSETANGIQLTPYDPEVARQLEAGREFAKEYRDTLRALAK